MIGGAHAVNTVIDERRRLCLVNFGDIVPSHLEAVRFARDACTVTVDRRFRTVVTSAAGYPLDRTFYQTVKSMVTPIDILAPDANLIIASDCSEGMGSAQYREAQRRLVATGPDGFLASLLDKQFADIDEWQTEMQLKPMRLAGIHLYSDGLPVEDRSLTGVNVVDSIEDAVAQSVEASGDPAVAVIPEGPYVVPRLAGIRGGEHAARASVTLEFSLRRDPIIFLLILRIGVPLDPVVPGGSGLARTHHAILPRIVVRPGIRQPVDGSGSVDRNQRIEGVAEDPSLQLRIVRLSRRMSEREVQVHGPWRVHRRGDGQGARHGDSRDAAPFDFSCNQSDGLMAHGSGRYQHYRVDRVVLHAFCERGREDAAHLAGGVDPAHERVCVRGNLADATLAGLRPHRLEREHDVRVGACVGQVVGEVGRTQRGNLRISRDDAVADVIPVVKRNLSLR